MRYTTVIDISQIPGVYKNINARLLYLHLALIAGYHDEDRDICDVSIRRLCYDTGLTLSAVRHALGLLERAKLVERVDGILKVRKWVNQSIITSRAKEEATAKNREQAAAKARATEEAAAAQEREKQAREDLARQGKTNFMIYYEDLQRKAEEGDLKAAEALKRHRATYELHVEKIKQKTAKK